MDNIALNNPIFDLFVDDVHVATLYEPVFDDMFWCSYRVKPVNAEGDMIVHDEKVWESVNFTVKDRSGRIANPNTFSGGFQSFCDRTSDRLSFRSLWLPQ